MKMTTNNIPQGYKDSPLGIIPEEWKVKKLGDVSECFSGGTPKASNNEYYDGNIPFIRSGEIHQKNTALFLSELGLTESSAKIVEKGDLLIALYGANSGDSAISQINGAINQAILCIRPHNLLTSFLCPFLELNKNMYIAKYLQGGQGNLSGDIIKNYIIPIPPLPEQQKIAEVLSTWDKAIEKQSQLIEKFELRKKGLMQQLLTGKKRLPMFNYEWKITALGNCAGIIGGGTPNTANENYWNGNIAWFTPSEIGKSKYVYKSLKYITKEGLNNSSANLLPVGTILFTSRATIGQKAILKTEAATNQGFQSLIISDVNSTEFFFYLLDILITKIKKKASGSTFPEISAKSLGRIKILIPQLKEQKAIAKILSFCDEEINLATQRLESLKQQKKGLMQVLLTGKKRIIK